MSRTTDHFTQNDEATMQAPGFLFRCVLVLVMAAWGVAGVGGRARADADPKVTMDLAKLVTPPETYQAMIEQMSKQMIASMRQSGAQLPVDVDSKLGQAVMEALPYDELMTWTVEVYAPRFTTDEIRQLIAFYNTPTGKKAAKLLPEISGEVGKKMGPIITQRLPAAMKKVGLTP
jgi:hypothetical protein